MSKDVYIRLRDGDKESELRLESIKPEHQLSLMQGVFQFFDLDVDFFELAQIYHRSGKAYKEFFDNMDNTEEANKPTKPRSKGRPKKSEISSSYVEALKQTDGFDYFTNPVPVPERGFKEIEEEAKEKAKEEVKEETAIKKVDEVVKTDEEVVQEKDNPEFFKTGIKYDNLNKPLYKLRYKCLRCEDEGNHYVPPGTKHVRCWKCSNPSLMVYPATDRGEPKKEHKTFEEVKHMRDSNGNYFGAGIYQAP